MRGILVSLGLAAIAVGTASGQIGATAPPGTGQAVGTVTAIGGEAQSVLVLRGGQVYQLRANDSIFVGDTVFTRTNGALRFNVNTCNVGVGGQRQFVVQLPLSCPGGVLGTGGADSAGTLMSYDSMVAGIGVGAGGGVGAAPVILGALALGGGAALAASGGGGPASP
jgi:hypothetical protein